MRTRRPTAETDSLDLSFFLQLTKNAHGIKDTLIAFSPDLAFVFWCQAVLFRNLGVRESQDVVSRRRVERRVELDIVQIC